MALARYRRQPPAGPGRRASTTPTLAAVGVVVVALGLLGVGIPAAFASPGTPDQAVTGQTSQTTLPSPLPGPTPTTAPPQPAPAPAPGSTTTTTAPPPKGSGVPPVPVGGPPTTKPPKGAPPPPPPDPNPILTAVDADLTQLTAIADYKQVQANVTTMQQALTTAGASLQSAQAVLASAVQAQDQAAGRVGDASSRLEHLAIAAYVGLGFASPAAGPQGVGNQGLSTVNTPGGLTGPLIGDAQEMLKLVAQHVRNDLVDTRKSLAKAEQVTAQANAGVKQAQATVTAAQQNLQSSQQTLAVVTQAATVPGAAAEIGLLAIPNGQAAADAPTTTAPPSSAGGADGGVPTIATTTTRPSRSSGSGSPGSVAASANLPPPVSPSILGPSMLTSDELAAWFASTNHKANTTVPIQQLAAYYQLAATGSCQGQQACRSTFTPCQGCQPTGIRFDLAFAQSVVETGFFSFPAYGQLTPADNNFAGIGACDSCAHGWRFPDALTGVSAQEELLEAYASLTKVDTHLIGNVGVGGCCPTWMALAGKWASSLQYGISIMTVYQQMLAWVIPQRLQAAGLTAPTPAAAPAQGPSLANLPQPQPH